MIRITTQAEWDSLPKKFDVFTEVEISAKLGDILSTPINASIKLCGGTVNDIKGGTVNDICGGTVHAIRGGTVHDIRGGTVNAIWCGTVNDICGGTVHDIRGGTVNAICSGTVHAICGGTVNVIWGGTVNAICSGTVHAICGGSVNDIWGGTVHDIRGGMVKFLADMTVNLASFNALILCVNCKVSFGKKQKSVQVVNIKHDFNAPISPKSFAEGCEKQDGKIILYKSVNPTTGCDFKTGTIKYEVGKEAIAPDFDRDEKRQCGGGLHLSPTPYQALSYNVGKVLVCAVDKKDIVVYPCDVTKVRCRKVKILKEWEGNK